MATGDPIFIGIRQGEFIPQAGGGFSETEYGLDVGERILLVHPSTTRSKWPKRDDADAEHPRMYVTDVQPRQDESTLIELRVSYKGVIRFSGGGLQKRHKLTPGTDAQVLSLSALSSGDPINLIVRMPVPTFTREYVTLTQPTDAGVGAASTQGFLTDPPAWSVTWTPDPDAGSPSLNYQTGWILDKRSWIDVADKVWLVTEFYSYHYALS